MLVSELQGLIDEAYDVAMTGFSQEELDDLLNVQGEGLTDEDAVPDVPEDPVAQMGDIWLLGDHRLMCGDSTDATAVDILMDGARADMVFTDPPYGLGGYKGRGKNTKRAVKNDEKDPAEFYQCIPSAPEVYVWGCFKNLRDITFEPRDVIVWRKNNFGMGKGYRGQYEVCFYDGGFAGSDSDVWDIAKDTEYKHPTQKPVALCDRAIKNSKPRTIVDIYGGSGSTLISCDKNNIPCYMMELDPHYCDVIVKRWEDFTGKSAKLESKRDTEDVGKNKTTGKKEKGKSRRRKAR